MCKCCQLCLESIYWHCCEKRFCYDEGIALYEEPNEPTARAWDNLAYWDSVQVLANRSVVTIQPLPNDKSASSKINTKHVHWQGDSTNFKSQGNLDKKLQERLDGIDVTDSADLGIDSTKIKKENNHPNSSKKNENLENKSDNSTNLRKSSVIAASLPKLNLDDKRNEIRLVRQNSVPNFYVETPEPLSCLPSLEAAEVLKSPVLSKVPRFNYDLRSIVQLEKSNSSASISSKTSNDSTSSRLSQMRKKIAPLIIKKPLGR